MNNKLILIVIVVVVVVVFGGYFLLGSNSKAPGTNQQPTAAPTQAEVMKDSPSVTVTATGYEPQEITVKAGETVTWTNNSGADVNVSSDNHPTHLLWPFLNLGTFADGSSVSVVFEKAGTYTYHNHLNQSQKGTVVVE